MTATETAVPANGEPSTPSPATASTAHDNKLSRSAIGLPGVIFLAVATAAPITALTGNAPAIIGFGVGVGAPAVFIVVTIILTIFSVGYIRLARHITTTGAFYGFVSHGLGQVWGLASGILALFAYVVFEVAIAGAFAYFAQSGIETALGLDIPWVILAFGVLAINSVLSYFKISLGTKVLGLFLILEVAILALNAVAGLISRGSNDLLLQGLNPLAAFTAVQTGSGDTAVYGSVGLAFFLAFWSWVGFESTAIYGEESRNPRRTVPIATFVSVIGVGVFYVFVTWATLVANGADNAIALSQSANPLDLFLAPARGNLGEWAVVAFYLLTLTGSFACSLAFHNSASRYLYAVGRDRVANFLAPLGKTHPEHQSPYIASLTQTVIAAVAVLILGVTGISAYNTFVLVGLLGTLGILVVQALSSAAVIGYFHKNFRDERHWFGTLVAPIVSGVALVGVIVLLLANQASAVGTAATEQWLFPAIPWIVLVLFVAGFVYALVLKAQDPPRYEKLGRLVLDEGDADVEAPASAG